MLRANSFFFSNIDPIAKRFVLFKSCSFSIWKGWELYQLLTYGVCKQRIIMETGRTSEKSNLYNHFCMEQKSNSERFRILRWWFRIKNKQLVRYSWPFTLEVPYNVFFPSSVEFPFLNSVGWVNRLLEKIILKWAILVSFLAYHKYHVNILPIRRPTCRISFGLKLRNQFF